VVIPAHLNLAGEFKDNFSIPDVAGIDIEFKIELSMTTKSNYRQSLNKFGSVNRIAVF